MKYSNRLALPWSFVLVVACNAPADRQYGDAGHSLSDTMGEMMQDGVTEKKGGYTHMDTGMHHPPATRRSGPESGDPSDSVFAVHFPDTNKQVIRGRYTPGGPFLTYRFTASAPATLQALLATDKLNCNVRLSRIEMPGGQTDGPFGAELRYKLIQSGTYSLVVGPNTMAGSPETCDFTLRIIVEEK